MQSRIALFKGRICLIHASADGHISFFNELCTNVYKQLNLQFIVLLCSDWTSDLWTVWRFKEPFGSKIYSESMNVKPIIHQLLLYY